MYKKQKILDLEAVYTANAFRDECSRIFDAIEDRKERLEEELKPNN